MKQGTAQEKANERLKCESLQKEIKQEQQKQVQQSPKIEEKQQHKKGLKL